MQDDTGHNISALRPEDLEKVQGLWKFQVHRVKAQTWAYRDIKFLVYDDTVDAEDGDSKAGQSSKNTVVPEHSPRLKSTSPGPGSSALPQTLPDSDEDPIFKQAIIASLKQPESEAGPSTASEHPPEDDNMDDTELQESIRLSLMKDDEFSNTPITAEPLNSTAGPSSASKGTPVDEEMETRSFKRPFVYH
ncbi:hypothetical protein BDP55DRAFT_731828 [Colletotrichum godetiae]|uniref:Uncharacterized protein n=1 Tax=Colletotrichum godetiae TaxID=1209918 RepID=A0AAJ0EU49_9PEZI|nr:uncharacterized protein BDP55DRAFT_731828 [Colletotrichum godetiae]KAK1671935.1 hypothetical protein BDP55DRAFT_731828 [Colletotrichum godetiae]